MELYNRHENITKLNISLALISHVFYFQLMILSCQPKHLNSNSCGHFTMKPWKISYLTSLLLNFSICKKGIDSQGPSLPSEIYDIMNSELFQQFLIHNCSTQLVFISMIIVVFSTDLPPFRYVYMKTQGSQITLHFPLKHKSICLCSSGQMAQPQMSCSQELYYGMYRVSSHFDITWDLAWNLKSWVHLNVFFN